MILVTGAAGFIGSNFVHHWVERSNEPIVVVDCLTYAGSLTNLAPLLDDARVRFEHANVGDAARMRLVLAQAQPRAVVHLAAETHVDRSIEGPGAFVRSNVLGTLGLLEALRTTTIDTRVIHVSTDEVFGSAMAPTRFDRTSAYAPNNPYAASKAGADHLVRAYAHTFGQPAIIVHPCNNYGPRQFPEKLIPKVIACALREEAIPVFGDGQHVRDWMHVSDTCRALTAIVNAPRPSTRYLVGARCELPNLALVERICDILDEQRPRHRGSYRSLIRFVDDRAGHDRRYALDPSDIERELGWRAEVDIAIGLRDTVSWYLAQPTSVQPRS